MDCKKALQEVDGDLESAIDWLRKKGISTAQKKADRSASDGLITVAKENNLACIVEINSETDFVARNEDFQNFCNLVSKTILSNKINNIDDLMKTNLESSKLSVSESLTELLAKIGENILIKRLDFIQSDNNIYTQKYIHNGVNENSGKIGVLLSIKCDNNTEKLDLFTKNLAMHIAAMSPKSIDVDDLDKKLIEREKIFFMIKKKNQINQMR